MNETIIIAVLGLVVAVLILRPLLHGGRDKAPPARPPSAPAAGATDELEELELDRAMGRVSESDYHRWKEQLAGELVPVAAPEGTDARARAESLVRQWSARPRPRCEQCGERPEPEARFCSNCGAELRDVHGETGVRSPQGL